MGEILFHSDCNRVDWCALKSRLAEDDFDNGRSPEQLQRSFENSTLRCFAEADGKTIGKARGLSDGVCNAYVVDVWTYTPFRSRGIATRMMRTLMDLIPGEHVILTAQAHVQSLYANLGFRREPESMACVVGVWLKGG